MKLTIANVRAELTNRGIKLTKKDGEFRVYRTGAAPGEGYFTNELEDARVTGLEMSKDHYSAKTPEVLTKMAHGAIAAIGRNERTIEDSVDFVTAMKGELGQVGSAYYAAIFASRCPVEWRDEFIGKLAIRLITG